MMMMIIMTTMMFMRMRIIVTMMTSRKPGKRKAMKVSSSLPMLPKNLLSFHLLSSLSSLLLKPGKSSG